MRLEGSLATAEPVKPSYWRTIVSSKDLAASIVLTIIACLLVMIAFWKLSSSPSDMLRITDYVTVVAPGQQRTFGYGGIEAAEDAKTINSQRVDVPFQSQTMSPVCFEIGRQGNGQYWIRGVQDKIQISKSIIDENKEIELTSGSRFKTIGQYGGAVFTVFLEPTSGVVRLHLESPIYYKLLSHNTRVVFGVSKEIVKSPIDEVRVRTVLNARPSDAVILSKKADSGDFLVTREVDLVKPDDKSEVFDALRGSNSVNVNTGEAVVENGSSKQISTVVLLLSRQSLLFGQFNVARLFPLKFLLIVLLLAFAFGVQFVKVKGTQVEIPSGSIIFGCVAIFVAIGVSLTARDYFQPPFNQERFSTYSHFFFYGLCILFLIRIPLEAFWSFRWLIAFPALLAAYIIVYRPLVSVLTFPPMLSIVGFGLAFISLAFLIHYLIRFLIWFTDSALSGDLIRVLMVVFVPIIAADIRH